MQTLRQILEWRRSFRDFDPSDEISEEHLAFMVDAARSTPTSFNIQNWKFVAVRDRAIKEKIKRVSGNQPQIAINSVLFVLCADLKAWDKNPSRYWQANGKDVANEMAILTRDFYKDNLELQRDEAIRSIGMAATAIIFAATDISYKCCPILGFDSSAVGQIINLPSDHIIGMMIAVGKQLTIDAPPKTVLPREEVLIYDFFPA